MFPVGNALRLRQQPHKLGSGDKLGVVIVQQMIAAENITEDFKRRDWLGWVQAMNSIRSRAEEIIYAEMIYL